ncbi:MAG: DedA family protein [Candidatus Micrarchaeaceae archaeon]
MSLLLLSLAGLFSLTYSSILSLIAKYGYYALFGLLVLEAASLPVPSEVILPVAGYFIFTGVLNPLLAIAVILFGGLLGMAINYYIAYFIGKDLVYKHLALFHIKKESLDAFDSWFNKNGSFAVFVTRMMPLVRGLINFPAGFALMPQKKFYAYSMLGTAIWDIFLITFGYYLSKYALSMQHAYGMFAVLGIAIGLLALLLFMIYRYAMKRIKKK